MSRAYAASASISAMGGAQTCWGWGGLQWLGRYPAEPGPFCCHLQAVQNVGNMDTLASRAKEAWMESLQPTVHQGVAQLKDFITKLVDIEEKEGEHFLEAPPTVSCLCLSCLLPNGPIYLGAPLAASTAPNRVCSSLSHGSVTCMASGSSSYSLLLLFALPPPHVSH